MPYTSFASSGAVSNPNRALEFQGFGTSGDATTLTTGGSNVKGSWVSVGSATSSNWSGFSIHFGPASSAAGLFVVDVSFDGGTTTVIPNLIVIPGNSTQSWGRTAMLPLKVPSGTTISMRCQGATGGTSVYAAVVGYVADSGSAPGFDNCEAVAAADLTNTRAGTVDVASSDSASPTYTELVASTSRTYGALLFGASTNTSNPATAQRATFMLATGAASSETVLGQMLVGVTASTAAGVTRAVSDVIQKEVASGTRLSGRVLVATTGDSFRFGVLGFY